MISIFNKSKKTQKPKETKKSTQIKEIPRTFALKILVARKNCPTCKGTGKVSWDKGKTQKYCLCCKVKKMMNRKWSRNYYL